MVMTDEKPDDEILFISLLVRNDGQIDMEMRGSLKENTWLFVQDIFNVVSAHAINHD